MLEVWLDLQALRGREAVLGEMESEDCLDLPDLKESLDFRAFLDWWEPKETEATREMLVTKEMRDPGE